MREEDRPVPLFPQDPGWSLHDYGLPSPPPEKPRAASFEEAKEARIASDAKKRKRGGILFAFFAALAMPTLLIAAGLFLTGYFQATANHYAELKEGKTPVSIAPHIDVAVTQEAADGFLSQYVTFVMNDDQAGAEQAVQVFQMKYSQCQFAQEGPNEGLIGGNPRAVGFHLDAFAERAIANAPLGRPVMSFETVKFGEGVYYGFALAVSCP
jgi:hypothetical protein